MTRRDYIFLANSFWRTLHGDTPLTSEERLGVMRAAKDMAYALSVNAAFDQELFLRNAGVIL